MVNWLYYIYIFINTKKRAYGNRIERRSTRNKNKIYWKDYYSLELQFKI